MVNPGQGAVSEKTVSAAEKQIRDELEADIEDDLETEIINNMHRLACHLQRLYQHKGRREVSSSTTNYQLPLSHTANAVLSEMNINIKFHGQCRIGITKVEQVAGGAAIQPKSWPDTDLSEKQRGFAQTIQGETVYHKKQQNHRVVPWR